MSDLTWDEVYARQAKRADLVDEWLDALDLKLSDHVLEVGAGPGYMSLILARRVGSRGTVDAVDRSAEALSYLKRLQDEQGIRNIRRIVADAAVLEPADLHPTSALITMVLHHADDPPAVLRNVARLLPEGTLAVIGEFDPEGVRRAARSSAGVGAGQSLVPERRIFGGRRPASDPGALPVARAARILTRWLRIAGAREEIPSRGAEIFVGA
jgi:ubiquinone/menaquinone biosynthesis C-methylase UbiE